MASFALHVLAFAVLPVLSREEDLTATRVLEVVLPVPETPPTVATEPVRIARSVAPARAAQRGTSPAGKRGSVAPPPAAAPPAAPIAEPETLAAVTPPAEAPPLPPRPAGVPAPATQAAPPPSTPPVFNAAYLRNPPPHYPLIARRNGVEGTVTLKVLVDAAGVPASVSVEKTSGSAHLDHAALDTVQAWRFVPARQGGKPVEAWVLVPIVFRLEGAS